MNRTKFCELLSAVATIGIIVCSAHAENPPASGMRMMPNRPLSIAHPTSNSGAMNPSIQTVHTPDSIPATTQQGRTFGSPASYVPRSTQQGPFAPMGSNQSTGSSAQPNYLSPSYGAPSSGAPMYGASMAPMPSTPAARPIPVATAASVSHELNETSASVRKLLAQPAALLEISQLLDVQTENIKNMNLAAIEETKKTLAKQIESQKAELARIETAINEIKNAPARINELPTHKKAKETANGILEHLKTLESKVNERLNSLSQK